MKRTSVITANAPAPVGPYSQAILADGQVFVSGQIPLDPSTGEIPESFEKQCHQVLRNLQAVLEGSGTSMELVVKVTIYMIDLDLFEELNSIYAQYFGESKPARACVEVSGLPKGAALEMDAIALVAGALNS